MDGNDFATGVMLGENRGGNCNGWGNGMFGMEWLFALLILPAITNGGFYGNGNRGVAEPVTESGLCNAMNFNNLEGAVGRISDQVNGVNTNLGNAVCNLGYETLRNFNNLEAQLASCCCNMEKLLLENRYEAAQNTSAIIQSQERGTQKILDYLCNQENMRLRDENMRNYIQSQFCGVVRYPLQTTYSTDCNPFFGGNRCGNCYGNGNI